VRACGGGLYAHRYKSGSGFDNPSVYCEDLRVLVPKVVSAAAAGAGGQRPSPAGEAGEVAPRHLIDVEAFDLLAAGPGDHAAMVALSDAMHPVNCGLVVALD
jgi:uncharacterized protein